MEPLCELCGAQRGLVYCKSDAARLCLPCDAFIHSANALSRRHLRALICDHCLTQHAAVGCLDDRHSLCQSCYRAGPTPAVAAPAIATTP
uniref:B box-type domain-containing protein n=1 Tax=Musa acuminata subsp. malaccensis TaxID=214687 RepID=A0A804JGF5_MUSAM